MSTELTAREVPASYLVEHALVPAGFKCPKGYKQTEVGVIPEDWEVRQFSDVAEIDSDNLSGSTSPDFSFNYISLEDVDVGRLMSFSEQIFGTAPSRARRKLRKNDVLVSTVRPNLKSHLWFSLDDERWVCSTGFSVVRCRENLAHPGFIYSHLFSDCVSHQIEGFLTGSNYPAINSRDVRALKIPMPPTQAEQEAIAEALSDADVLIASLERLIAKQRQLKQGAMQELLTGKKRLPGFGEQWEVKTIQDIGHVGRGRVISQTEIAKASSPDYPVYSSQTSNNGVMGYLDTFEFEGDYITWTTDGANAGTVFARSGRFNCTNVCGTIKLNDCDHKFIAAVLGQSTQPYVSRQLGNPKLMNDVMKKIEISIPKSITEQTAIASILSDMDSGIAALEARLAKTRDIKQGMMQELLTGRIRLV